MIKKLNLYKKNENTKNIDNELFEKYKEISKLEKEDIIIGFFLSHEFEYENTLKDEIRIGNIKKGDKVKDFYNNITYERYKYNCFFKIFSKPSY